MTTLTANQRRAIDAQAVRALRADALRSLMDTEGLTFTVAARRLGLGSTVANHLRAEFGIYANPAGMRASVSEAQRRRHAKERLRNPALLADLERLRAPGLALGAAATQLRIGRERAVEIWAAAHPGVPFYQRPAAPEKRPAATVANAAIGRLVNAVSFTPDRQMTPEQLATKNAAIAHARRTAALPPVTDDDAARLVAEHLARRGVTVCAPACAASINNGYGL